MSKAMDSGNACRMESQHWGPRMPKGITNGSAWPLESCESPEWFEEVGNRNCFGTLECSSSAIDTFKEFGSGNPSPLRSYHCKPKSVRERAPRTFDCQEANFKHVMCHHNNWPCPRGVGSGNPWPKGMPCWEPTMQRGMDAA